MSNQRLCLSLRPLQARQQRVHRDNGNGEKRRYEIEFFSERQFARRHWRLWPLYDDRHHWGSLSQFVFSFYLDGKIRRRLFFQAGSSRQGRGTSSPSSPKYLSRKKKRLAEVDMARLKTVQGHSRVDAVSLSLSEIYLPCVTYLYIQGLASGGGCVKQLRRR